MERLLFITQRLRAYELVNCNIIADHFEVSAKTIQRDLDFLRDRLRYDLRYNQIDHSFELVNAPEPVL